MLHRKTPRHQDVGTIVVAEHEEFYQQRRLSWLTGYGRVGVRCCTRSDLTFYRTLASRTAVLVKFD